MRRLGPALAIAVAATVALVLAGRDPASDRPTEPEPVEISSDGPTASSLGELAAASDLVVRGRVVGTQRGRLFGEPGQAVVESRLLTLTVDVVLAGPADLIGTSLSVEEPGWLEDGTPLIVDGLAPSAPGDDAVWFLDAVGSPAQERADDAPGYVLVGPQGRYLVRAGRLVGAAGDDPLVRAVERLGLDGLVATLRGPSSTP